MICFIFVFLFVQYGVKVKKMLTVFGFTGFSYVLNNKTMPCKDAVAVEQLWVARCNLYVLDCLNLTIHSDGKPAVSD